MILENFKKVKINGFNAKDKNPSNEKKENSSYNNFNKTSWKNGSQDQNIVNELKGMSQSIINIQSIKSELEEKFVNYKKSVANPGIVTSSLKVKMK